MRNYQVLMRMAFKLKQALIPIENLIQIKEHFSYY
jgi:hypothetical protein